ncbi:MAG: MBL fold metallo-hydrolase [Spirochaetaceae bacterium]|nr:MAG: MBL fold metallo-hydrolase [Spirochaetaceae bacterium]
MPLDLTVLADNNTLIDQYFLGEPGVSYHLQTDRSSVLFDTGYSGVFLTNAHRAGVDLASLDAVVLSHGHIDHTGGLDELIKLLAHQRSRGRHVRPALIAHPVTLMHKQLSDGSPSGIAVSSDVLSATFQLRPSREPVWIDDRLVFLGEIERTTAFEAQATIGLRREANGGLIEDDIPDDSALAWVGEDGIVVITACSHSGICNIVETARRVTGVKRVIDIIGGFHLLDPPEDQLRETVAFLSSLSLQSLHACHCTDLRSKIALSEAAPLKEVGSGMRLQYADCGAETGASPAR